MKRAMICLIVFVCARPMGLWAGGTQNKKVTLTIPAKTEAEAKKKAIVERRKFLQLEADAAKRRQEMQKKEGVSPTDYEKSLKALDALDQAVEKMDDFLKKASDISLYGNDITLFMDFGSDLQGLDAVYADRKPGEDAIMNDPNLDAQRKQAALVARQFMVGDAGGALRAKSALQLVQQMKTLNADLERLGLGVGTVSKKESYHGEYDFISYSLDNSINNAPIALKYALIDVDRASGKLSADAVDVIMRESAKGGERAREDAKLVAEALYAGESYVDRQNNRVRLSNVVLRPAQNSVNRVYFTDRRDGDYLGLSIVSLLQVFNRNLPIAWGAVVSKSLDQQQIVGGLPEYYLTTEQLSFASPDACKLCISQTFSAPTQVGGAWRQAHTEQYGVQGLDRGFVRYDAAGNLLGGSDTLVVTKTLAEDKSYVLLSYYNNTQSKLVFDAKLYLVGQGKDAGRLDATELFEKNGFASLRDAVWAPADKLRLLEINLSSPEFAGASKQIDVLVTGEQFLTLF